MFSAKTSVHTKQTKRSPVANHKNSVRWLTMVSSQGSRGLSDMAEDERAQSRAASEGTQLKKDQSGWREGLIIKQKKTGNKSTGALLALRGAATQGAKLVLTQTSKTQPSSKIMSRWWRRRRWLVSSDAIQDQSAAAGHQSLRWQLGTFEHQVENVRELNSFHARCPVRYLASMLAPWGLGSHAKTNTVSFIVGN